MEDRIAGHSPAEAIAGVAAPVAWRDLRDWLDLVEANGLLKHIAAPVEPDEELGAITLLATRREDAPALLFEQLAGDRSQARILCNMLGASKERYALAVGLDPGLSIAGMIAATRGVMNRRISPVRVAKGDAPVNEIVLTGNQIDLTAFPVPKFWPADGTESEPADWQITWDRPEHSGFAGLTGGSGGLSEFEVDYVLIKAAGRADWPKRNLLRS